MKHPSKPLATALAATLQLAAIAAVGVYYVFLWLFRDRLKNEYSFYIKEK